ncbi:hypothetical protein BOX15_Mlig024492g1 [Macrostomum lignano]|uniref:Uncharacterized protein n=2 Tax=Macrostomum lignano TaxID=282301 RepID=A0A267GIG1_9PLAT|nr:hypothetical protein BOX15_Mlig024492g1 [Macrostomum lignano]
MANADVSKSSDGDVSISKRRVALLTGITGQDGSYLAELLLSKGYQVHGIIRRASTFNTSRIEHLYDHPQSHTSTTSMFKLHYGDMTDSSSLVKIIQSVQPTEVYNLAAQSHVKVSFDLAEYTAEVDAVGTLRLLDAIKTCGLEKSIRFYQASTSEMYGEVREVPQTEKTPFYPRSPYGVAKLYAYWICINYREAYGMHACNGILFNHESPRRGENFVTRKITRAVAKIVLGQQERLELGNLDAKRDWGHAKDYVEAMHAIMQLDKPDDFVIATGEARSVREFVVAAFACVGIQLAWRGAGLDEIGYDAKDTSDNPRVLVCVNPKYFRPSEVEFLLGDASKAKQRLGWSPKYSFEQLVKEMVDADMQLMKRNPMA